MFLFHESTEVERTHTDNNSRKVASLFVWLTISPCPHKRKRLRCQRVMRTTHRFLCTTTMSTLRPRHLFRIRSRTSSPRIHKAPSNRTLQLLARMRRRTKQMARVPKLRPRPTVRSRSLLHLSLGSSLPSFTPRQARYKRS